METIRRWIHWLRYHFVVMPVIAILDSCGLGDDFANAVQWHRRGWRTSARQLTTRLVILPLRLLAVGLRAGRGLTREVLFGFGLVHDDVHASHAMNRGILLRAAPVVIALASIVGVGIWLVLPRAHQQAASLESAARDAIANHDYANASIAYERLVQLRRNDATLFDWAIALEHLGDVEHANELMAKLAPDDAAGYPPAQLWVARRTLEHVEIDANQVSQLRMRLSRVLEREPENAEANLLMAKLLLNLGERASAEPYLVAGASLHPELRLLSAEIGAGLGDHDQQRREAAASRDYFQEQLALAPSDVNARIGLAKSYLLLGEYNKSVELLREGMRDSDAPALREALSEALTAWSLLIENNNTNASKRFDLLTEALRHDPRNGAAIVQMLELRSEPANLREQVDSFIAALDVDALPALTQVALGNVAWADEDFSLARKRFERAYVLAPEHPGVANNLAWALAHSEPLELDRAKQLCDEALRIAPMQPNLLDTRSDILMQLSRWREAQVDLDALARLYPGMPGLQDKIDAVRRHL